MSGRKALIGLTVLCALAFGAIAAPGAMAETKTTTAFTCVPEPAHFVAGFSKEHCREIDAVPAGPEAKFKHVEIPPLTWTTFDATNAKTDEKTEGSTNAVFKTKIGGFGATITAKQVTKTGELENFTATPGSGAMDIKQRHVVIHFEELTLSGTITSAGCKLANTSITTNELEGTSLVNTMEAEYKPEVGTVFWTITLKECTAPELNKTYNVEGTFKSIGDGATTETTTTSTAGLSFFGQAATLTMKVTPRMTTSTTTENPIGSTTIVDP